MMNCTSRLAVRATSLVAIFFVSAQPTAGQTATRPNIVVIMADDLDTASLSRLVDKGMMPNLKRHLVDVGFEFTESFSTGPFASPSRATFLTGQYPHNHGEIGGNSWIGETLRLDQSSTVATWLKAAGYRTGMVGRYLTGYGLFTDRQYIPPGWDHWAGLLDPTTWSTDQYWMNVNRTLVDFGTLSSTLGLELYQTDVVTLLAGGFIREAPSFGRPFFLVVNPVVFNREMFPGPSRFNVCPDPTDPLFNGTYWGVAQRPPSRYFNTIFGNRTDFALPQLAGFNEADVEDKPDWVRTNPSLGLDEVDCLEKRYWRRLEAMRAVDDLVGHVVAALEDTGALENTVLIFTADNGLMDGQHRFPEKSPAYDESIRVPLLIRVPGHSVPRRVDKMVLNTDLAPTIANLAQAVPTRVLDGRSLLPLIEDPNHSPWRGIGLFQHVTDGPTSGFGFGFNFPPSYVAVRTDVANARLFVRYPTVTIGVDGELYDLTVDPYELDNRYTDAARSEEVERLRRWADALKTCRGLTCYILETYFALN
jgi:N-acetylglucosamine-6-sulfatase